MKWTRKQQIEALMAAGYRIQGSGTNPDRWAKPIGLQILTVELDHKEMTLWFMGETKIGRWDVEPIFNDNPHYDDPTTEVLGTEAEIEVRTWRGKHSHHFGFLTKEQQAELILDEEKLL